ncbi:N-acetylglucosamine kinase [Pseudonocardia sp. CA-107938]|uniref:N-acetylglucosamine kinase n=1 Tax=Pseudonocardia sp. CA-107938 TaxID=3240021 RepID=UPI003D91C48C
MDLYLGVDAGGTRTRVAVTDSSGHPVGAAEGGGGNPVSHPWDAAVDALAGTVVAALGSTPADRVAASVIGLAGFGCASDMAAAVAARAGLCSPPLLVSDVVVAYAAGSDEPDGCVLVAGTGATAGRVTEWQLADSVDGHGWLLGDTGSAFWLGRAAVQAALAALEDRRVPTALLPAVTAALLPRGAPAAELRGAIIAAVHAGPPVALARLAPLVAAAATDGDAVAGRIVDAAVSGLVGSLAALRPDGDVTPLVVAGGVAGSDGPVGVALRTELDRRWPGCVRRAGDGALAAARLARELTRCPPR